MTTDVSPAPALPITGVEKTMAAVSHGSWMIGIPFVPAILSLVWGMVIRPSAFLRGHALQAIILQAGTFVGLVGVMCAVFGAYLLPHMGTVWSQLQAGQPLGPTIERNLPTTMTQTDNLILVFSLLGYIGLMSCLAVYAMVRAFEGRPDAYALIGRFFR